MRVLVIGSGGREHALVKAIAGSERLSEVFALPGNAGIRGEATLLPGDPMDVDGVLRAALTHQIDFCVVAPEEPLAAGLSDALRRAGIPCFGPSQEAARLESSKVYAKELMRRYQIPTADFAVFDDLAAALTYAKDQPYPLVIKADGLAKGKGVVIAESYQEAEDALRAMLEQGVFGRSGSRVIIEEMLQGPEISLLCLSDGESILPLPSAMDHKRAQDGDQGPNTGGMGAVAPNPWYTKAVAEVTLRDILLPTIRAMREEGHPFKGCLFVGLMLTADGPKVLEYNVRFGDPEAQAVLPLIESDVLSLLIACEEGRLSEARPQISDQHACCLVMASGGYPGEYQTGFAITAGDVRSALCFAGVKRGEGENLVTAGGRVLSLTALGDSLKDAISKVYQDAENVVFEGRHYRKDIGHMALKAGGKA